MVVVVVMVVVVEVAALQKCIFMRLISTDLRLA